MRNVPRFLVSARKSIKKEPDLYPAEDVRELAILLETLNLETMREVLIGEWIPTEQKWELTRLKRAWTPARNLRETDDKKRYVDDTGSCWVPIVM